MRCLRSTCMITAYGRGGGLAFSRRLRGLHQHLDRRGVVVPWGDELNKNDDAHQHQRLRSSLSRRLSYSSSSSSTNQQPDNLVLTELDSSTGIATVTMQNPPANSLSLEMLQALSGAIQTAEEDAAIQALVLQSSNPKIFSAGLELTELLQHNDKPPERLPTFWSAFQQLYMDLYPSRLACIAAIAGHAPAAGCMLALSCDYRLMLASSSSKIKIGLNESQFGLVAPPWLAWQMMDTIGRRPAELSLQLGRLYTPEQALEIGLVDQLVAVDDDDDDDDDCNDDGNAAAAVHEAAHQMAQQFVQIPAVARVKSKMLVRQERLDQMKAIRQADLDDFVSFVTTDKVQSSLKAYLDMLASNSKKKKK